MDRTCFLKTVFACLMLSACAMRLPAQTHGNLFAAMESMAHQLHSGTGYREMTVAVLDFTDAQNRITPFGSLLSEELITSLVRLGGNLRVVERRLLFKAVAELNLQRSDLFDPQARLKVGQKLKAHMVVVGTYFSLSHSLRITAQIVDIERGDIIAVAAATVDKSKDIEELLGEHPEIPPPPPLVRSKAGEVVFKEDFSRYGMGDAAKDWGSNLAVLAAPGGRKALSTQVRGLHTASRRIPFPRNFSLEIEFVGRNLRGWGSNEGTTPTLVDKKGAELRILLHGNAPSFQLPGSTYTNARPWNTEGTFKLTKMGTTYKVFWRDQFIVSGDYASYSDFVELRFRVRPKDFIGRILVTNLGD